VVLRIKPVVMGNTFFLEKNNILVVVFFFRNYHPHILQKMLHDHKTQCRFSQLQNKIKIKKLMHVNTQVCSSLLKSIDIINLHSFIFGKSST